LFSERNTYKDQPNSSRLNCISFPASWRN